MTAGTAVPIAPVKLVDGARGGIVPVDGVAGVRDAELALVLCMLERSVQLGFHPPKPLHDHVGKLVLGRHPCKGSEAMVSSAIRFMRRSRLHAEAMVIWSKGLKCAKASKSRLKVRHPCLRSLMSDSQ